MQHALLAFGLLPSMPPPRAAAAASAGRVAISPRMATDANPSIAAATPCDFPWWSDACSTLIADLDAKGGERFVASHDDEGFDTRNWLHVTSSSPLRRAQYEMRYCAEETLLSGVARFGEDCEGPPGFVHGGAIATVADAATATATFKAAGRWGLTTRLECNYREMLPLCTPVRLQATVTSLKPRKCVIDWELISLTEIDRKGAPVRHAFGSADFLLAREPKAEE
jgi:acyl-coenzyme A thioesterase PaaI-like protein